MGVFDFVKKIPTAQMFGFLGNVAEGALNAVSGASANRTNKDIAQLNNEFNERMMDKQFQQNVQLMDLQNNYNSPTAQVQRLREAGLNPAFALGQVSSGSVSSKPSGTGMASAQGAQVQPIQFNGLSDAMRYLMDKQITDANVAKLHSETQTNQLNNQFLIQHNLLDLQQKFLQNRGTNHDNYAKKMNNQILPAMLGEQFKHIILQNRDLQQSTQMKYFETLMLEKQFNVFDTEFKMRMSDMMSQIEHRMAQKELTENQATHEVFKWLETQEKTSGLKISNETNRSMVKYIVEKARKDSRHDNPIQLAHDTMFTLLDALSGKPKY